MTEIKEPNPPWDQAITAPEFLAQPDDITPQQEDDMSVYRAVNTLISKAEIKLEAVQDGRDRDVTPTENLLLAVALLLLSQHCRESGLDGEGILKPEGT
jgi:hypothetical protein